MKKHLSLVLFVSFCVLNACSDDDSNNTSGTTPTPSADGKCTPETYQPTCPTANTYTACSDGIVVIRNCPEGVTCENGVCPGGTEPAADCSPESFVGSCMDDSHKTVCGDDHKVTNEVCPTGTHCVSGECVSKPCDGADFVPECTDDTHYTVCKEGVVATEACEGDIQCFGGKCSEAQICDETDFVSECIDDMHYTVCKEGVVATEACEGDIQCVGGKCSEAQTCVQSDFVPECQGTEKHTICTDEGIVSSENCPEGTECSGGECLAQNPDSCDPATFTNTCDGNMRKACDGNVVTTFDCASDGLVCYQGECILASSVECDPVTFENKCIGNTVVKCGSSLTVAVPVGGIAIQYPSTVSAYDCAYDEKDSGICAVMDDIADCYRPCPSAEQSESALICDGLRYAASGKCVVSSDKKNIFIEDQDVEEVDCESKDTNMCVAGQCIMDKRIDASCSVDTDKSFCENGLLYYCYDDDGYLSDAYYRIWNCEEDGYVCVDFNSNVGCYEPCKTEGAFYFEQYDGPTGEAYRYECTMTPNGLFYIPSKAECYCVLDSKDSRLDCKLDSRGDICINTKSALEVSQCDGNIAKNVMELKIDSADGSEYKPFEYIKDCGSQTCVLSDGEALCLDTCTEEDAQSETVKKVCGLKDDEGEIYYSSRSYQCEQMNDLYYWIEGEEEYCDRGCAEDQTCKRIHESEGTSCSMDDANKCDKNIFLECRNDTWEAYDCGKLTCAISDNIEGCISLCTEEEVANPLYTCNGDYAEHQTCEAIKGGKYAKVIHVEYCEHGCDTTDGQCIKLHKDEGTTCGSSTEPIEVISKCDGSILLSCNPSMSSYDQYEWGATDCASAAQDPDAPSTEGICVIKDSYASCEPKCTASDVDSPKAQCTTDTDGNSYISRWSCVPSGENYYWERTSDSCLHGCNEGKTACLKLHDDEGKSCSLIDGASDFYESKCEGSIYLGCNGFEVNAVDCGTMSCHKDLSCYMACETVDETSHYCEDENTSVSGICIEDTEHGIKRIEKQNMDICSSGCNSATGLCK